MATEENSGEEFVHVAEVEIDAVQPAKSGFVLTGRGRDGADYRLAMELEMPIDQRTRHVLAELLAQSDWRILRRARDPFRVRQRAAKRPSAT